MSAIQPERPQPRKPALKLVKTEELSREDWLAVRRTGIGGSDAAAAVGLNPYQSPLELWLDKTGRADGLPRPDTADTTSANVSQPATLREKLESKAMLRGGEAA